LFQELRSDETLKTLREIIYNNEPETLERFATASRTKQVEEIGHVVSWLDILGILVRKDIVDKDLAIMGFAGVAAVKSWYRLANYIRAMQRPTKRGFYAENYEDFAHECVQLFSKQHIKVNLEDTSEDVVEKLQNEYKDFKKAESKGEPKKIKLYPRSLKEIKEDRKKSYKESPKEA